jgi:hypothetical protein
MITSRFHQKILLVLMFLSSVCKGQQIDTLICTNPDSYPSFKYDTCSNISESVKMYFIDNFNMPDSLVNNCYEGKVLIGLVIEKDGSISKVELIRGIYNPLDNLVLMTAQSMPRWTPGIYDGKVVRSQFIIPVSIKWLYKNK